MAAITSCRYCGSRSILQRPGKGPHPYELRCGRCNRHLGWAGHHITLREAMGFVMPFGMWKEIPLGEIEDDYLRWLSRAEDISGRIKERVDLILTARQDSRTRCPSLTPSVPPWDLDR